MRQGAPESRSRQVPAYEVRCLVPKSTRYCVGLLVLNENGRLHRQLGRMRDVAGLPDVLIADGGSDDGSVDPDQLRELGVSTLLIKTGPGALSAQMRMLFAFALDEGYEGIITMDGNGKDGVEAIPEFVAALTEGYDFVQGSGMSPAVCIATHLWTGSWVCVCCTHPC